MPFTSEKQRRYLWATQPDLAKRWAKKYPKSNKNLPMYAHEDKKASLSAALQHVYNYVNARTFVNISILAEKQGKNAKTATDECVKVKIPHSARPTYAGEEREKGEIEDTKIEPGQNDVRQPANAINSLLQKISVVLSQPMAQALERQKAIQEGREPAYQPKNHGIKRYQQATPSIPLPMGMQAPAQPAAQPQQAAAQPQKTGMGMRSPSANPINSFGALSSTGNINGNAAFGQKNSPDSLKTAQSEFLAKVMSMDFPPHPDPEDLDLDDDERMSRDNEKFSGAGLWANIRAKKQRGGKPAKPGDKDYPDAKNWKKVTAISEKKSAAKPCSCGCGDTVTTCKCSSSCSCRKAGGSCYKAEKKAASSPAWQRSAGKNEEGGLNAKGRASYKAQTGGTLKAPVTESNPTGERDKRQNSFCSRMCGMKRVNTGASTAKDPDSRINKSLSKWNCKCSAAMAFGQDIKAALLLS